MRRLTTIWTNSRKRKKNITPKTNVAKIADTTCLSIIRNTSESLLNKIQQSIYSLYRAKQI